MNWRRLSSILALSQNPRTMPCSQNIHLTSLGKIKFDNRGEDEPCSLQPGPASSYPNTYLGGNQKQMRYHGCVFQQCSEDLENLVLVAMACEQKFYTVTHACKK